MKTTKTPPALWLAIGVLALLAIRRRPAAQPAVTTDGQTITVNGRTLLGPGLWRTEDWSSWTQLSGPAPQ